MQIKNPRYSIVIPTFERENLLEGTIAGCLLQDYDDFELLISNNFSKDNTEFVLAKYNNNSKVRIVRTDRKLSMPDHWAFAMTHARGDYILFLGDDDGISPRFFKIIDDVINLTSSNIIKFKTGLFYHSDWSGIDKNTFHFDSRSTGGIFNVDIDCVITSFCDFTDYKYFPSLLTCVFRRDLYLAANKVVDQVFVGAPDHTAAFLLLSQPEARLGYIDMVLGYGGRSENSNASFYAVKERKSNEKKSRHTEWASELTSKTSLPHHQPNITTPANFLPAAFSYAKFFYPARFSTFSLNHLELCKVIQRDLVDCLIGRRPAWHSLPELANFNSFVHTHLNETEKELLFKVGEQHSVVGRIRILIKRGYIFLSGLLTKIHIFNIELYRARNAQKRVFDTRIDLSHQDVVTGHDLMGNFDKLICSRLSSSSGSALDLTSQSVSLMGHVEISKPNFRIYAA